MILADVFSGILPRVVLRSGTLRSFTPVAEVAPAMEALLAPDAGPTEADDAILENDNVEDDE